MVDSLPKIQFQGQLATSFQTTTYNFIIELLVLKVSPRLLEQTGGLKTRLNYKRPHMEAPFWLGVNTASIGQRLSSKNALSRMVIELGNYLRVLAIHCIALLL